MIQQSLQHSYTISHNEDLDGCFPLSNVFHLRQPAKIKINVNNNDINDFIRPSLFTE